MLSWCLKWTIAFNIYFTLFLCIIKWQSMYPPLSNNLSSHLLSVEMWFPCWKWNKRQTSGPQAWCVFTSLFPFPRSLYHYPRVLFSHHHLFTLSDSLALSGFLNLPIILFYLPFSVLRALLLLLFYVVFTKLIVWRGWGK